MTKMDYDMGFKPKTFKISKTHKVRKNKNSTVSMIKIGESWFKSKSENLKNKKPKKK